jgi:hypothetical protein
MPGTVTVVDGYSLLQILKGAGVHLNTFQSVEIPAPEGPAVVLTNTQATSPYAYQEGGGPPVVWSGGAGTQFLVPSTPTGAVNAGETFAGPGGTVTIELHRGLALNIGISAVPVNPVLGQPVHFTAQVYGASPLTYQWSFGDSTTSSQASPSHVYTAIGTYNVYLQATGSGDSVGASPVTHIVVGNPPPTTGIPGSGAGGNGTGSGAGGGTSGAGGTGAGLSATTSTTTPRQARTTGKRRPKTQRSRKRAKRRLRPVGPLVSGTAIDYVAQPNTGATTSGAGSAQAAGSARTRARAAGLREGMWIWFGVFAMLFGGALLEWNGAGRPRLLTSDPS